MAGGIRVEGNARGTAVAVATLDETKYLAACYVYVA